MTFGLKVFEASGRLGYSSDDVTWNQLDFFLVPGYGSVSRSYPIFAGREMIATQLLVNPPPLNRRAIAHTVSIGGGNVSVYGGSETAFVLVLVR